MTKQRYWKSLQLVGGKIVSAHDKSPWVISEWREVPTPTCECEGLNCCENIVDAMGYVNMEVLAEVEIGGVRIDGNDKITTQRMRIVRAWKWEKKDSVTMAVYAAELVIGNFEKCYPNDSRVRDTINLVKKYLITPSSVTEDELLSAMSAAMSAAWSAWSAAWSARSAAWSAAESAMSAAWSARSAAESAAESAARSAAERTWQSNRLAKYLSGELA